MDIRELDEFLDNVTRKPSDNPDVMMKGVIIAVSEVARQLILLNKRLDEAPQATEVALQLRHLTAVIQDVMADDGTLKVATYSRT